MLRRGVRQLLQQQAAQQQRAAVQQCSTAAASSSLQQRPYSNGQDEKALSVVAKNLMVDTLSMMKRFEAMGMTRSQAEAITQHITEVLCSNRERLAESFVSKTTLEKLTIEQQAQISSVKIELMKTQDVHLATVSKDLEKQQGFLDRMKSDVRHEIDKLTASQRLDLNLEKGRMRDDLQTLRDKTTALELKIDREVNEVKTLVERTKTDTTRYTVYLISAAAGVIFTLSRLVGVL